NAALAAGEARDDEAVVVERRARDRVALLPALRLHGPDHLPARLIERDELAVELTYIDFAVPDADTAARPAAAHRVVGGIEIGAVVPEYLAAVDAEREDVVGARHDVDDSVDDDRLRFARILRPDTRSPEPCAPHAFEVAYILAIDLGKRRVASVV